MTLSRLCRSIIATAVLAWITLGLSMPAQAGCDQGKLLGFVLDEAYIYSPEGEPGLELEPFENLIEENAGKPIMVCGITEDNLVEVEVGAKRRWIEVGDAEFDRPVANFVIQDCRQRNELSEAASAGAVKCP